MEATIMPDLKEKNWIILVDVYCFGACTGEEKEACYYWMNIKNT